MARKSFRVIDAEGGVSLPIQSAAFAASGSAHVTGDVTVDSGYDGVLLLGPPPRIYSPCARQEEKIPGTHSLEARY